MSDSLFKELLAQAISMSSVKVRGLYTTPRSWGVYKIAPAQTTKRYRYGNYPVRQQELKCEFDDVELVALYSVRVFAQQLAFHLNHEDKIECSGADTVLNCETSG